MTGLILASDNPLNHVVQHTLVSFGDESSFFGLRYFPLISNHIIMQVVAAVLLVWLIPRAVQMRAGTDSIGKLVPRGVGHAIEALCEALRKNIFRPNLGKYTDTFSPYLWSVFFFIFACNILGMIPLADWLYFIKHDNHPVIGGTSTGNIFVTGTLAVCTLVMIVANGLRYHGLNYLKHFFMGPFYLNWFVAFLEMVGLLFKTMALAVRLFANMLAGHILLAVLLGFVGSTWMAYGAVSGSLIGIAVIGASILVYFLEIVVALLHAFIFTALTAVFLGQAVNIHHGEPEHDEEHGHGAVATQH
jgi:F-type H+-transporting ATPase subunit a